MTTRVVSAIVVAAFWLQLFFAGSYAFSARGPSSAFLKDRGCRCGSNYHRTASGSGSNTDVVVVCWASPQEELAAALTSYLAKAHEEKLRAVQEVQMQKDEQIEALKNLIAEQQGQPTQSALSSSIVLNGSTHSSAPIDLQQKIVELESKLRAYQDFVAKYIVDAQNQKLLAVKAAEVDTAKKLGAQLQLPESTTSAPPPPPATGTAFATSTLTPTQENALYLERNARIAEAAKAGKSRWGDLEVQRAALQPAVSSPAKTPGVITNAPAAGAAINGHSAEIQVPAAVQEADHGLRAEGSVGGWSLAERVAFGPKVGSTAFVVNGSVAVPAAAPLGVTAAPTLYQLRNANVLAAGKVGKSRWGEEELSRVSKLANSLPAVSTQSVVSVAPERVNIGAAILGKQ